MLERYLARAFRAAAAEGHVDVIDWLIAGGLRPEAAPTLADVVHLVVERAVGSTGVPMLRCLAAGRFDISAPRKGDGWTPLHLACSRNLVAVAEVIIELGADVNAVGLDDRLPLNLADRVAALLRPRKLIHPTLLTSSSSKGVELGHEEDAESDQARKSFEEETEGRVEEDGHGEDGGEDLVGMPEQPLGPDPPPTPLQALLMSKGARRTWRRDGGPGSLGGMAPQRDLVASAAQKSAVRFSGFAGERRDASES